MDNNLVDDESFEYCLMKKKEVQKPTTNVLWKENFVVQLPIISMNNMNDNEWIPEMLSCIFLTDMFSF